MMRKLKTWLFVSCAISSMLACGLLYPASAIGTAPPVLEGENLAINSLGECMQFTGKTHVFDTWCHVDLAGWTLDGVPADGHGVYCTTTTMPVVFLNAISLVSCDVTFRNFGASGDEIPSITAIDSTVTIRDSVFWFSMTVPRVIYLFGRSHLVLVNATLGYCQIYCYETSTISACNSSIDSNTNFFLVGKGTSANIDQTSCGRIYALEGGMVTMRGGTVSHVMLLDGGKFFGQGGRVDYLQASQGSRVNGSALSIGGLSFQVSIPCPSFTMPVWELKDTTIDSLDSGFVIQSGSYKILPNGTCIEIIPGYFTRVFSAGSNVTVSHETPARCNVVLGGTLEVSVTAYSYNYCFGQGTLELRDCRATACSYGASLIVSNSTWSDITCYNGSGRVEKCSGLFFRDYRRLNSLVLEFVNVTGCELTMSGNVTAINSTFQVLQINGGALRFVDSIAAGYPTFGLSMRGTSGTSTRTTS
ncbi:MAG: hypothetical protein Q6370_011560 [Candidatus Sigynarchaeota archaeon]